MFIALSLTSLDPKAREFYDKVFSWTFKAHSEKLDDPDKLAMFDFHPDVSLTGGIQKMPDATGVLQPGGSGGVCIFWLVEDLVASAAVIEGAGGRMLSEAEKEGDHGVVRYFRDTEGTIGGLYQMVAKC